MPPNNLQLETGAGHGALLRGISRYLSGLACAIASIDVCVAQNMTTMDQFSVSRSQAAQGRPLSSLASIFHSPALSAQDGHTKPMDGTAYGAVGTSWRTSPIKSCKADNYENYFADVSGDGRADWIRVSKSNDEAWIALGLGGGAFDFWTKHISNVGNATEYTHYFTDIDGDGRLDWIQVAKTSDKFSVALAIGGGDFDFWTATSWPP